MAYLSLATYRARAGFPGVWVDRVETEAPGWVDIQLEDVSARIDAQLAKRYAVPFASPPPRCVMRWLAALVDPMLLRKRGIDQTDQQYMDIRDLAAEAMKEIEQAANGETGLFDLPARADTAESGISRGGPLCYSEASPYVWTDVQGDVGRSEDSNRRGSYG